MSKTMRPQLTKLAKFIKLFKLIKYIKPTKLILLSSFLVVTMIVLLAACGSNTPPTETPEPPTLTPTLTLTPTPMMAQSVDPGPISPDTQASVRFVLTVPNAPALDIYVGTAFAVSRLSYGTLSDTIPKAAGKYLVRALPAGSALSDQNALLAQYIEFAPRQSIVVVLTGTPQKLALSQITQNTDPVDPGMARIQFVHALQDAAIQLDILTDDQLSGSVKSAGQWLDAQPQKATTHTFQFANNQQIFLTQSNAMTEEQVYTLIVCGPLNKAMVVIASAPTVSSSKLRVVNVASHLGPVDVYIGDKLLAQAIDKNQASDWVAVPTYYSTVRVMSMGIDPSATPLFKADVSLRGDQGGDLVITDQPQSLRARIFWENLRPTALRTARLAVLNAAPGAVQMLVDKAPFTDMPPVPNNSLSISVTLDAGTRQLAFANYGDLTRQTVEEVYNPVPVNEGMAYLYVVTGAGTTTTPLLLATSVGIDKAALVATAAPTSLPTGVMQIRFVNAIVTDAALDVHVGNRVLFTGLKRGQISGAFLVKSGDTAFWISPAGSASRLAGAGLSFEDGKALTLIVVGGDGPFLRLAASLADIPTSTDRGMVQVVNAGEHLPPMAFEAAFVPDVSAAGPPPTATPNAIPDSIKLTELVGWSGVVDSPPLLPGKYLFFMRQAPDALPSLVVGPFTIEAGKHYELVLMADSGTPRLLFLPLDVL